MWGSSTRCGRFVGDGGSGESACSRAHVCWVSSLEKAGRHNSAARCGQCACASGQAVEQEHGSGGWENGCEWAGDERTKSEWVQAVAVGVLCGCERAHLKLRQNHRTYFGGNHVIVHPVTHTIA